MITLSASDYSLMVDPVRGGSIAAFAWRNEPLMRPTCGPSILDTACFPLVPFSNRIAHGSFTVGERHVQIRPNFPGRQHPHPLHGFGWLARWAIVDMAQGHATIEHDFQADDWPWSYSARQTFRLDDNGLIWTIDLTNRANTAMPAGVGLHPYFPRNDHTIYRGLHRNEWDTRADGLPRSLTQAPQPRDWWSGRTVGQREVDTVYTGRSGSLDICWPDRNLTLRMTPSAILDCTVVYTPKGEDFFCIEPVSHETNAINRAAGNSLQWLASGQDLTADIVFTASVLDEVEV